MEQIFYVVMFIARTNKEGQAFLMARRREGQYMGGTWQLISGGIEEGEIAWRAALREMREETGLRAVELYRLFTTETFYRADCNALCTAIPFLAIVGAGEEAILNDENTEFRWIPRAEMAQELMWPQEKKLFEELCREILDGERMRAYLRIPMEG